MTEINFSKQTLTDIIDTYIDGYSTQFCETLSHYKALIQARMDITRENMVLWGGLTLSERRVVTDFFLELGKHSSNEEIEKIKGFKTRFNLFRVEADEKLKRDASIYFKICVLLGIGVVILLI